MILFYRSHSVPETSQQRDANVTVIQVSAADGSSNNDPLTSPPTSDSFDFSFVNDSLNHDIIIDGGADERSRGVIDEDGEEEFFTPPVTPVFPRPMIRRPVAVNPMPRPRPSNRSDHPIRQRSITSTIATTDDLQHDLICTCDLSTPSSSSSSSGVNATLSSSVSVPARPQNSQDSIHVNQLEANHHQQLSSVQNSDNNAPSQTASEQLTPHQTDLDNESSSHYEHVFLSTSSQFSPATVVMPDTVSNIMICFYIGGVC